MQGYDCVMLSMLTPVPIHPVTSQCYDRFMLSTLKACAEQITQPSWGLGGPHDAGSYCIWPHQVRVSNRDSILKTAFLVGRV